MGDYSHTKGILLLYQKNAKRETLIILSGKPGRIMQELGLLLNAYGRHTPLLAVKQE
jgi:hypothetical protein